MLRELRWYFQITAGMISNWRRYIICPLESTPCCCSLCREASRITHTLLDNHHPCIRPMLVKTSIHLFLHSFIPFTTVSSHSNWIMSSSEIETIENRMEYHYQLDSRLISLSGFHTHYGWYICGTWVFGIPWRPLGNLGFGEVWWQAHLVDSQQGPFS